MQPALLGGLFIGILSALPVVSTGNCCCLWIIGGGFLAAYLDAQDRHDSLPIARGAFDGLMAGIVGACVWILFSVALAGVLGPLQQRLADELGRRAQGMPPETRAWFEAVAARTSSPLRYLIGFCFQLFVGMVFAPLGGVLGALLFRNDPHPGGSVPPPIP